MNIGQLADHVLEHKEKYYRLAYSYVKNKDDALDIVQESICKAMSGLQSLKNPDYLKTWFYRIVVNTALDFIRQRGKAIPVDGDIYFDRNLAAGDTYENIDLSRALDSLPAKYRTVVILRYFEDLKIEEVAKILGENVNTIKTRLYAALKKLRVEMTDDDGVRRTSHGQ